MRRNPSHLAATKTNILGKDLRRTTCWTLHRLTKTGFSVVSQGIIPGSLVKVLSWWVGGDVSLQHIFCRDLLQAVRAKVRLL